MRVLRLDPVLDGVDVVIMICNLAIAIRYVKERRPLPLTFLGDRMNRLWWPERRVIEGGSWRITVG